MGQRQAHTRRRPGKWCRFDRLETGWSSPPVRFIDTSAFRQSSPPQCRVPERRHKCGQPTPQSPVLAGQTSASAAILTASGPTLVTAPPPPSYLRHRQRIPRGRSATPARTHRLRTARAEDAAVASKAAAVRSRTATAYTRSRENLYRTAQPFPDPLLPPKPKSLRLCSQPTRSEKQMTHNLTKRRGAESTCRHCLPHAP